MKYSRVDLRVEQRLCTIEMHHAKSGNALDETMSLELSQAFVAASKDTAIKVVVLTGFGSVFCAGEGSEYLQTMQGRDFSQHVEDAKRILRLSQIIYTLRKPVVARINGPAHDAGCMLATLSDFAIASHTATFGFTEARNGLIPAAAVPFLVKKIGEGRARELMLLGDLIGAERAKEIGLVTAVASENALDAETARLTSMLDTDVSSASTTMLKEMFATLDGMKLAEALDYAANMHAASRMTDDGKKGMLAMIQQEKITW